MSNSYSCGRRGKVVTAEMASMIPAASSVSRGSHGFLSSSCRALDGHRSIARNLLPGRVTNHSEWFLQEAQARRLWDSFAPVQTLVWARGAHWSGSKVLVAHARVGGLDARVREPGTVAGVPARATTGPTRSPLPARTLPRALDES